MIKELISSIIKKVTPDLWYYILYRRTANKMGDKSRKMEVLFDDLIEGSSNLKCLQIGARDKKYAPHFISVDLYDQSDFIDYHYDITDMKFENDFFDIVVCNAILEHVDDPVLAIEELKRVLKKGGRIWVEIPFNQPYHPSPNDYWRVTLPGIRTWMKDFDEISAGVFRIDKSSIYNGVFFFGSKR